MIINKDNSNNNNTINKKYKQINTNKQKIKNTLIVYRILILVITPVPSQHETI